MTDTVHVDGPQSQALATTSGPSTVIDTIRSAKFKQEIQAALPESVSPDRFARVAITALLQNPSIQNASRESVLNSLLRCAQDGLLPDGQQAALVMFQNKAQYMPMVGGYRQIAAEHGWSLRTFLVYENDAFDYELGPNPLITHKPPRLGTPRGSLIGVYATAKHRDGRNEVLTPMTEEEIEKIRSKSRAKNNGPWVEWREQMWEKTAAKKLFKRIPLDPADTERIRSVIEADDTMEVVSDLYGAEGELITVNASLSADPPALTEAAPPTPAAEPTEHREVTVPDSPSPEATVETVSVTPGDVSPAVDDEPIIDAEFMEIVEVVQSEEEIKRVNDAMTAKVPSGSYQNRTLQWMLASGPKADDWLAYGLRQSWPHDKDFYESLKIVCEAHRPDVYNNWKDGK